MSQEHDPTDGNAILARTHELRKTELNNLALLIDVVGEVDAQLLYRRLGYRSTASYLTHALQYSKSAARLRIRSARLCRRFPRCRAYIADGRVSMTNLVLVGALLDDGNVDEIMELIIGRTKREVSRLVDEVTGREKTPASGPAAGAGPVALNVGRLHPRLIAKLAELRKYAGSTGNDEELIELALDRAIAAARRKQPSFRQRLAETRERIRRAAAEIAALRADARPRDRGTMDDDDGGGTPGSAAATPPPPDQGHRHVHPRPRTVVGVRRKAVKRRGVAVGRPSSG